MSRGNVRVRVATRDDLDALLSLHGELRTAAGGRTTGFTTPSADPDRVCERYALLLDDPLSCIVLAVDDSSDEPLGMALLRTDPMTALLGTPALSMHHLIVARRHRRRGAGRALVAAAAAYADERDCEHLIVGLATDGREAHRYFARLGFAPLVTRRVASLAALRRTLGVTDGLDMRSLPGRMRPRVARVPGGRRGIRRPVGSTPRGRAV